MSRQNLDVRTISLIICKALLQIMLIGVCLLVPLLLAAYVYSTVTTVADMFLLPDLSLNYDNISGMLVLLFTIIPEIVFALIILVGLIILTILIFVCKIIQRLLLRLIDLIDSSIYYKDNILDSQKFHFLITMVVIMVVLYVMYSFFSYYDFNMNYFCYDIGGSDTFGSLINENEWFRKVSTYITLTAMALFSYVNIDENYSKDKRAEFIER